MPRLNPVVLPERQTVVPTAATVRPSTDEPPWIFDVGTQFGFVGWIQPTSLTGNDEPASVPIVPAEPLHVPPKFVQ